jgi:hypothetical protein
MVIIRFNSGRFSEMPTNQNLLHIHAGLTPAMQDIPTAWPKVCSAIESHFCADSTPQIQFGSVHINPTAAPFVPGSASVSSSTSNRSNHQGRPTRHRNPNFINHEDRYQDNNYQNGAASNQMCSEDYSTKMERWLDMDNDEFSYVGDMVPN